MSPISQMLHKQVSQALGCTTDEEYQKKRIALLAYLRRAQPAYFSLEGGRRRSFELMAKMEGTTAEEKLEDLALTGYLVQRSIKAVVAGSASLRSNTAFIVLAIVLQLRRLTKQVTHSHCAGKCLCGKCK